MQEIQVQLNIQPQEVLKWYKGGIKDVQTRSLDGRNVTFPFEILHPYISNSGVIGLFLIIFNDEGKFREIKKKPD